jgi:hypothetical protein
MFKTVFWQIDTIEIVVSLNSDEFLALATSKWKVMLRHKRST